MGLFNFGKIKDVALEKKLQKLQQKIENEKEKLREIKEEIALANDTLDLQEYGFFERQYKFSHSTKYKDALDTLRMKQKTLIKNGEATSIISPMTLDGSAAKGKAMQNQLRKAAIRGFNGEADALLVKVSVVNVDKKVQTLQKAFEQLNKMYERNLIQLTFKYLDLKAQELRLAAEYELQKQEEKEILREQRAREREDKKLQAEITAKRKQLEKDRKHFLQMVKNVEVILANASPKEQEKLQLQLIEYQNKLSELDKIEEDIDYREGHATAGYVYVISNIGAFGEDVYKIGVTRRLDPMDRIRELGSASVPFTFDVHALIFSEEAFALESELHNKFEAYKVNKINSRKEYFRVPFAKIKEVLENHKELAIEITEEAEAFEYRQSILKNGG
ncbi:phage protein [Streptococcus equi subsp. equi]|uniref:DUF4041 domain-containing protein n=1 Tax=Streptococcus equi TaxID=1336 RepID=UPI000659D85F|nr:DUF4041 domain-containing protein [Streptococcus equi]CRW34656.1 phage protein [Streptococcus equi subsp. equi]